MIYRCVKHQLRTMPNQWNCAESRRLRITLTISICTNIEKYAIGQHCNNMEKYANTIRVLVTHVSYTEFREHNSRIFQYSSIPELRQLSSRYYVCAHSA